EIAADGPRDIVSDGGSTDATFGPDNCYNSAYRFGVRRRIQIADRSYDVESTNRTDQVFAHTASRQPSVQHDIVDASDHDDLGAGVAHFGQMIEPPQDFICTAVRLDQDDVRCGRIAVGFACRSDAAHLDFHMSLGQAAVLPGRLNGGSG